MGKPRKPMSEAIKEHYTEEEWYAIPAYQRARISKRLDSNWVSEREGIVNGKLPRPPFLEDVYTEEEWENLHPSTRSILRKRGKPYTRTLGPDKKLRVPDFVLEEGMTEEEFNNLNQYARYHIRQKGTTKNLKEGPQPKRIKEKPKELAETQEDWVSFSPSKRFHIRNRKTRNEIRAERCLSNPIETYEKGWAAKLWRDYKIRPEIYWSIYNKQNGLCAICKQPEKQTVKLRLVPYGRREDTIQRLCVDHEHSTGIVRGLLCHDCNKKVKSENKEAIEWFKAGLQYLENAEKSKSKED